MKIFNAFFVVFLILLALSSCSQQKIENNQKQIDETPQNVVTFKSNEFFIDGELPDIGEFSGKADNMRFYKEYTPDFIPSDEYGEIIPYIGKIKTFSTPNREDDWSASLGYSAYGFCTPDGKIVMDADLKNVYINYWESGDGKGFYTLRQDSEYQDDGASPFGYGKSFIIPKSGEWCITIENDGNWVMGADEGYICIASYAVEVGQKNCIEIYDYSGNLVKRIEDASGSHPIKYGLFNVYNGGLKSFIDIDGNVVLGPYISASSFYENGLCIITDSDGYSYLINSKGEKVTDGYYQIMPELNYNSSNSLAPVVYSAQKMGTNTEYDVLDTNGKLIRTVTTTGNFGIRRTDEGKLIYFYTDYNTPENKMYWKYLDDDSDFVSKEFGVMPNEYVGGDNLYIHFFEGGNGAYIFDGNGETLANLPELAEFFDCSDDGRFILFRDGLTYDEAWEIYGEKMYTENISLGKVHLYDSKKKEIVHTFENSSNAGFNGAQERFIVSYNFNTSNLMGETCDYYVYDTLQDKVLFESCKNVQTILDRDGYLLVIATDNAVTTYDEDLNIIKRIYND